MSKWSDCILYPENMEFPKARPIPWIAKLDDIDGLACSYSIHWNMPFDAKDQPVPKPGCRIVGHPPHMHKENELIFMIGNDPGNTADLGAEVEVCLGPEMERFIITKSCCLQIPANTPHGFYHVNKCWRPWMFIQVQEANPRTEKFLWEYLTPEEIASIPEKAMQFWVDVGYEK